MAKQAVGPVIRYLDKAILAVTGAAFIYFLALFGVLSPNKVGDEGGEQYGPGQVDSEVKVAAESLIQRLQSYKPTEQDIEEQGQTTLADPVGVLEKSMEPLVLADVPPTIPRPVQFAPPVKKVGVPTGTRAQLAEVVTLEKPQVHTGRSGIAVVPPVQVGDKSATTGGQAGLVDVNWATVHVPFDVAAQEDLFRQAEYQPNFSKVWLLGLDVQRREVMSDGTTTEWQDITPTALKVLPPLPQVNVEKVPGSDEYNVPAQQIAEVDDFAALISEGENQVDLMRPFLPEQIYGDQWTAPSPSAYTLKEMDAVYGVQDRKLPGEAGGAAPAAPPAGNYRQLFSAGETALNNGDLKEARRNAEAALSKATSDRDKKAAQDLLAEIERAENRMGAQATTRLPIQSVWVHDAGIGSLRSGRTYQYRVRPLVFNNHCAKPALLTDPQNAAFVALPRGEWSEPSDAVTIQEDSMFFVTRAGRGEVRVEVFKWYLGEWLCDKTMVKIGEPIGERSRVETPPNGERQYVNFFTGATAVDIDPRRPVHERRQLGDKLGPMQSTTALIYDDGAGHVAERLLDVDKLDPLYKTMRDKCYKP